jgi:hypothetical protein
MAKATKIDANSWIYCGVRIERGEHSRTYVPAINDGQCRSCRRLSDAVLEIDLARYRAWEAAQRNAKAAAPTPSP